MKNDAMLTFLAIVGLLVLLLATIFVLRPVLILVRQSAMPEVKSQAEICDGQLTCVLSLENSKSPMYITELHLPRDVGEKIGLEPPDSFCEQALQDRKSDAVWLEQWNADNLRFAGKCRLEPDFPRTLEFPLSRIPEEPFTMQGQFETGKLFANLIGFFEINIEQQ